MPFLAVIEGAMVAYLAGIGIGPSITEAKAFAAAIRRSAALVGAFLRVIAVCVVLIATIIGIPVAVYLLVRWLFVAQAVMLDGASGGAALGASARLVQGSWWQTLGRGFLIALFVFALNIAILGLIASGPIEIYALVSAIVGAFTTPYLAIAFTLMYFDLRARKAEALGPQRSPLS